MRRMIVSLLVSVVMATASPAQASSLAPLDGKATDVGLGANGVLWAIGTQAVPGGFTIHRWNGTAWDKIPGGAIRIAVDPQGAAWVVNDAKTIFRWNGTTWEVVAGDAIDVGIGADGTVWVLNGSGIPQRFANGSWTAIDGRGSAIAVGPKGAPYVVGTNGAVFRYDLGARTWAQIPGAAKDIAVAADGTAYMVGAPEGKLFRLDGTQWTMVEPDTAGERIAAGPLGTLVIARTATSAPALLRAGAMAAPAPLAPQPASLPAQVIPVPPTVASTPTIASTTVLPPEVGKVTMIQAPTSAPPAAPTWNTLPGNVTDVGVGANGALWAIGSQAAPGGFTIHRWNGAAWETIPGGAVRIAVDPKGAAWVVNSAGRIIRWNGTTWETMPGAATDVGIGADGTVWVLGGGGTPYRWTGSTWTPISGAGTNIAVGPTGEPWVVNAGNAIFRYTMPNGPWQQIPGAGRDIAVAADGTAYHVGMGSGTGPATIYAWRGGAWVPESVAGERVAAGPAGTVAVVKAGAPVVAGNLTAPQIAIAVNVPVITAPTTSSTTIAIPSTGEQSISVTPGTTTTTQTGTGYTAPVVQNTAPSSGPVASGSLPSLPANLPRYAGYVPDPSIVEGKLLCSEGAGGNTLPCGTVEPLDLGAYRVAVPTDCPAGSFWDAYFGGTCWKCDGNRTMEKVDTRDACSKEVLYRATKVKNNVPFAWDCPAQSFWDSYNGGACYHCGNGNRTGYHIDSEQSCSRVDYKPATFVKAVGCTEYEGPWEIGKPRPYTNVVKGKCYACPVLDPRTGDVLISDRILDATEQAGCKVRLRWQPTQVKGKHVTGKDLEGQLKGSGALVSEIFAHPEQITAYLKFRAAQVNTPDAEVPAFIERHWADIAKNPNTHPIIHAMLFKRALTALMKAPGARTVPEQQVLDSFQDYVQAKHEAVPQDALDMYRAWKHTVDVQLASRKPNVGDFFYYGTPPLDFDAAGQAVVVGGGLAVGTAGVIGSIAGMDSLMVVGTGTEGVLNSLNASFKSVEAMIRAGSMADDVARGAKAGVDAVKIAVQGAKAAAGSVSLATAGATIITIVYSILFDVAIDQVVAIETAEPMLKAKLESAQQPVSLERILQQKDGPAQLALLWSSMTEGEAAPDLWLQPQAVTAAAAAKAAGYPTVAAAPPSPWAGMTISGMSNPEPASISAIDRTEGTVAARLRSGGLVAVIVSDAAALTSLRVGGGIWVDRSAGKASLDGKTACCRVTGASALLGR